MVHRTERSYLGPFLHRDVSAESRSIREEHMIADEAIMSHVHISHNQCVTTDTGQAATFHRAAVDGHELPNGIVVANLQARRFALVAEVLRRQADRGERKETVVRTDFARPFDCDVGNQFAALPQLDIRPDHAVGADLAPGSDTRSGVNYGGGVNRAFPGFDGHSHQGLGSGIRVVVAGSPLRGGAG